MKFQTLDDAEVRDKTVLLRVDINSPVDPKTGKILDDTRIRECAPTLRELVEKRAKVVVLAHQGRPGDDDFTTLKEHAEKLSEAVKVEVGYIEDIFGPSARKAIELMHPGEILLLENVRFFSEENLERPPEKQANTILVRTLAPLAQLHINDAFAAAHRSQPSLVGFAMRLPTYAGRLMERELNGLSKALSPERPCVYVLGGIKVDDSLKIIENVLNRKIADFVLTGGCVAWPFLMALKRDLGKPNLEQLKKKGYEKEVDKSRRLLDNYGGKIKVPLDVVVDDRGKPRELRVDELPTDLLICDVGSRTVDEYSKLIAEAGTVVANGPLGVFERAGFERGTFGVLEAMANSRAFTIVGGGHIVAATQAAGLVDRMKHVSTGGGACISFLAGEPMPVIEVLTRAKSAQ